MIRTRVGYTGGTVADPTYYELGDHTETLEVDFDPEVISYRELLEIFWASHNPCARPWSLQYRAAVFYHDAEQEELARETAAEAARSRGREVHTAILPAERFYLAEDYHQKYHLRRVSQLEREYEEIYPDLQDFVDSTAAARVNGYLAGHGKASAFRSELDRLGLSSEGQALLSRYAQGLGD